MLQLSFSDADSQAKQKQTRREKFLMQMDELLPWSALEKPTRRYYSKSLRGRKPYPLSTMLQINCMKQRGSNVLINNLISLQNTYVNPKASPIK